jgi:hypothetical protein
VKPKNYPKSSESTQIYTSDAGSNMLTNDRHRTTRPFGVNYLRSRSLSHGRDRLDTLKFARALRDKAQLTSEQAEGFAQAFAEATGEQMATKSDLREELSALRAELVRQGADLRGEIAAVKADVLLLKWMKGFVLAFQVGIFAKLFTH